VQAELQQTPLAQKPVVHALFALQGDPLPTFATHTPALQ
jgi:hypothetical protein